MHSQSAAHVLHEDSEVDSDAEVGRDLDTTLLAVGRKDEREGEDDDDEEEKGASGRPACGSGAPSASHVGHRGPAAVSRLRPGGHSRQPDGSLAQRSRSRSRRSDTRVSSTQWQTSPGEVGARRPAFCPSHAAAWRGTAVSLPRRTVGSLSLPSVLSSLSLPSSSAGFPCAPRSSSAVDPQRAASP